MPLLTLGASEYTALWARMKEEESKASLRRHAPKPRRAIAHTEQLQRPQQPLQPQKPLTWTRKQRVIQVSAPPFFPPPENSANSRARHSALTHSLAPKTLAGYPSTIARFWSFCEELGTPVSERFPASETVLVDFAASFAGVKAGSTAANALAGLHTWHNAYGHTWNAGSQLPLVVKGVTNMAPSTSKRTPRPAVTREMLNILYTGLDLNEPTDAAVFAAATVAFWGQCRLGELLGTARLKHSAATHPSRSSLAALPTTGESIRLHLPRTKTTGVQGASIQIPFQRGRADPSYALYRHFRTNYGITASAHLFAFRGAANGTRCLTKEVFVDRCNTIWAANGIPRITGHSFRIGGTNAFLEAGVPSDVVRVTGRWKSNAYFVYWRDQDRLAAAHTERIGAGDKARARIVKRRQG